jgi:hypothetical protein
MTVTVKFTNGKVETFRKVEDVKNQDRDYRLPGIDSAPTVLIPKTAVMYLIIEGL